MAGAEEIKEIKDANEANEAEKYMKLAADAFYAHDGEPDYETAFQCATKAAEFEMPHAMTILGSLYLNGYYVQLDFETARKWFEKAAEMEDPDSCHFLRAASRFDPFIAFP